MKNKLYLMGATAAGAVAAYLWDPDNGKARRAKAKDQSASALHTLRGRTAAQARHQRNVVQGWMSEASEMLRPPSPVDDTTLVQKVRSEVIGNWTAQGNPPVDVRVSDGKVTLHTSVSDPDRLDELLERVLDVEGVRGADHIPVESRND